jgi:hypothetical protein
VAFVFFDVATWKQVLEGASQPDYWLPEWLGFPLSALFVFFVRLALRRLMQLGWPWPQDYESARLYGAFGSFAVGAILCLLLGLGVLR